MAATESAIFAQKMKELDPQSLKCIKFREGCMYYGQVEYPEPPKPKDDHPQEPAPTKESQKQDKLKADKNQKDKDHSLPSPRTDPHAKKFRNGLGVQMQYRSDGTIIAKYEGSWLKDKKHGFGIATYADKSVYYGSFKNDLREGKGTYRWSNGYAYEGEWKEDKMDGQGKFFNPKGGSIPSTFRNNWMLNRKGIYINPFLNEKDLEEFMDKREKSIQAAQKASTPSEKSLIFDVITTYDKIKSVLEFSKSKGRVPFFLSSKR